MLGSRKQLLVSVRRALGGVLPLALGLVALAPSGPARAEGPPVPPAVDSPAESRPTEPPPGDAPPLPSDGGGAKPNPDAPDAGPSGASPPKSSGEPSPGRGDDGSGGQARPPENRTGEKKVSEKKVSDKKASDKKASDKKASEKKASDKKASEKKASEKKASEKKASEKKASEKKASDKKASDKKASEKKASEKKASEKKASEKKASDGRTRRPKGCPKEMAFVQGKFCIDRYEAYVVEIDDRGRERAHSPFESVAGKKVKARSAAGKIPQGYISRDEAEQACRLSGKRLCSDDEWLVACKGKRPTQFPYGDERQPGRCNDTGRSSFNKLFGSDGQPPPQSLYTWDNLNDPRLNRMAGTLAPAGKNKRCRNSYGLYDMVGNLHEWTASPSGTFRGGYYLDVEINGLGCDYRTRAHGTRYHDYSTGFRCCK